MSATRANPTVDEGVVTVLRLYDVANAIDLAQVEQLAASPSRIRLQRTAEKAISFDVPPVEFSLGQLVFPWREGRTTDVTARVYDFGAVSIAVRIRLDPLSWTEFSAAVQEIAHAADRDAGSKFWESMRERLQRLIAPALDRPNPLPIDEDYLIASVHRMTPQLDGATVLEQLDLVPLLSGETRTLAPGARAELLKHALSYYAEDLVVPTWDRAFVLDSPEGSSDIADVLELANAQLLELRYYDDQLDDELPRMYQRVAEAHHRLTAFGRKRYAVLARELHRRVAEVTEITERVDNALKVTEDVYLARVYSAALELFRTRTWGAAVDRKLSIMRDTYTTLYEEAATSRAELLEVIIVLLILFEIVWAFVA